MFRIDIEIVEGWLPDFIVDRRMNLAMINPFIIPG
jgi:hypothetical protein